MREHQVDGVLPGVLYFYVIYDFSEYSDLLEAAEMINGNENNMCCPQTAQPGYCKVESLVAIDERGQMVLPKEIRERADIHAGDKLVVIGWERDGKICCISLIKSDELSDMVKVMLSPLVKNIFPE